MPSLFTSLSTLLADRGAAATLAPLVGGAEADVDRAIDPSLARLVDGLATLADTTGPETVAALVDRHDTPRHDELDRHLADGPTRPGHEILDRCYGAERGLVVIGLASALGLAPSLVGRLLPLLAPVVTAELARRWDADGSDEVGLADLLRRERRAIERAGLLQGTTFDEAGLAELLRSGEAVADRGAAATTPATAAIGGDGDDEDGEAPGSVTTLDGHPTPVDESRPIEAVDAEAPEDLVILRDDHRVPTGDREVVVRLEDGAGRADENDEPDDADATDDTEDTDTDSVGAVVTGAGGEDRLPVLVRSTDGRGAALAWLGWAVGAVVLVLLLASLLSTCTGSGQPLDQTDTVIAIGSPDAEPDPPEERDLGPEVASARRAALSGIEAAAATATGFDEDDGRSNEVAPSGPGLFDNLVAGSPEVLADDRAMGVDVAGEEGGADGADNSTGLVGSDPAPGTSLNELLALDTVTFDSASADLTDEGRLVLDKVARFLADHEAPIVEIGGHTDSDGDDAANLELSQARADAVLRQLAAAGIDRGRLIAIGHGDAEPRVPNDSLANKAINRRIEFIVR